MPHISSIVCAEGSNGEEWVPLREGDTFPKLTYWTW